MKSDYNTSTADRSYCTSKEIKDRKIRKSRKGTNNVVIPKSNWLTEREEGLVVAKLKGAPDYAKVRKACDRNQAKLGDYEIDFFLEACDLVFNRIKNITSRRASQSPSRFWVVSCTIKNGSNLTFRVMFRAETRKDALHGFYNKVERHLKPASRT
jgi:hypothetical protein